MSNNMPKKLRITEAGLIQLFKTWFSSKLKGNEETVYDKLVKANPEIGQAWKDLEQSIIDGIKERYAILKKNGIDTSNVEALAKKMGVKLE